MHVHVPKCGGSTFRGTLQRNFKEAYYSCSTLMDQRIYSKKEVGIILKRNPWLHCYSDHKLSLDLPYDADQYKIEALAFVRDPLSHFLSHYFWAKNNVKAVHAARGKSLDEYLEIRMSNPDGKRYLSQIKHLNPAGSENPSVDFVRTTLEKHNVSLFPIEEYDKACIYLERRWPDKFTDLSYTQANVSKKDSSVSPEQSERIKELIKPEFELIELANTSFNEKFSELFTREEAEKALADFKKRCSRKSNPLQIKSRKIGKRFVKYVTVKFT